MQQSAYAVRHWLFMVQRRRPLNLLNCNCTACPFRITGDLLSAWWVWCRVHRPRGVRRVMMFVLVLGLWFGFPLWGTIFWVCGSVYIELVTHTGSSPPPPSPAATIPEALRRFSPARIHIYLLPPGSISCTRQPQSVGITARNIYTVNRQHHLCNILLLFLVFKCFNYL